MENNCAADDNQKLTEDVMLMQTCLSQAFKNVGKNVLSSLFIGK